MKFKEYIDREKIDFNVTKLVLSGKCLLDLEGIEEFKKLEILDCSNNDLTKIDISKCNVKILLCNSNKLDSLILCKENSSLEILCCSGNCLEEISLKEQYNLSQLYCSKNKLKTINLSDCIYLREFNCNNNDLIYLDLRKNEKLLNSVDYISNICKHILVRLRDNLFYFANTNQERLENRNLNYLFYEGKHNFIYDRNSNEFLEFRLMFEKQVLERLINDKEELEKNNANLDKRINDYKHTNNI